MSLYGNIASTAPFQFDRIFGSRSEMDQYDAPEGKFVDDGVYAGRYVLVKYDTKNNNTIPVCDISNDDVGRLLNIINETNADSDIFTLYRGTTPIKAGSTDPRLLPNQIYAARVADPAAWDTTGLLDRYFFFEFTGDYDEKNNSYAQFQFIQEGKITDDNASKYLYPIHYAMDREHYKTIDAQASSKGYDGTIWMKTYVETTEGNVTKYQEQYIYIGSLNASMPALKVTPEAPESGYRMPHLNVTDSDTYDLHITTPCGFRVAKVVPGSVEIKDSSGQRIPELNEKGARTGNYLVKADSDVEWNKSEVSDTNDGKAIYYNKAGFDVTENHIDDQTDNELLCELTGYSGQRYVVCDENGNMNDSDTVPDIYELQMKLPILGNVVAELWNLAYGEERNLDIAWEDGYAIKRPGKRLLPVGKQYTPAEANTIAGCINSMHDLMGMIIVKDESSSLPTDLKNYGLGYIYYFTKLGRFYRVEEAPYYNESNKLSGSDFTYEVVTGVDEYTFVPGLYYNSNKTLLNSYATGTKYVKKLSATGKAKAYQKIKWEEMLDPAQGGVYEKLNDSYYYTSPDLISEGKTYYTFNASETRPRLYEANKYYRKFSSNGEFYKLDGSNVMSAKENYYSRIDKEDYSLNSKTWLTKNSPNKSIFYHSAAVAQKALAELKTLLKSKANYSMQSNSVFFYKDTAGIYQPVGSTLDSKTTYYIGVNWQPRLDWDETKKQFVYLYYPTNFYPTTLLTCPSTQTTNVTIDGETMTVTFGLYYYDPSSGWRGYNENAYAQAIAKNIYQLSVDNIATDYSYSAFYVDTKHELVDATSLNTSNIFILDNNKNYIKATAEAIKESGSYYTLSNLKEIKYIYKPNKYYIASGSNYNLDTRTSKSANTSTTWYVKKDIIVKDSKGYYPDYSIWDAESNLIPGSVELYVSDTKLALVELEEFARQLNTAHGLILKINQVLDTQNTNTRDKDTVKGMMNKMDDILNKFALMSPGDFLVVDGYGRMHGAKAENGTWIDVKVKPDPDNPTVKFEHADPGAEGIWITPTVALSTGTQAVVAAVKIDNKGHLDKDQVIGVSPDKLLFTIGDYTRTFADWITWAANQGGGSGAVVTDWISNATNPFYYSIDTGRLRAEDGTGLWTLSTNPAGMLSLGTVNSRNVTLDKTSSYNSLLPSNKQFTITLGYSDTDMFNNDYTATTVNTETFSVDLREALAAPALSQGSNEDQNLFTPIAALDTTNTKEVAVTALADGTEAATIALTTSEYSVNTAIDLDKKFANKLAKNTKYSVSFQAISNNEGYKNSESTIFHSYIYEKIVSLSAPVLSQSEDQKDDVLLTWTEVSADGVTDIKYILKKDGKEITTTSDKEYTLKKSNSGVSGPEDLNGKYTVEATGTYAGSTINGETSNAITVNQFIKLDTPEVTVNGNTVTWDAVDDAYQYVIQKNNDVSVAYATSNTTYEIPYEGTYFIYADANTSERYFDSDYVVFEIQQDASHNHTWNSGTITTVATCGTSGVKTYTCTVCNETKTETIPATGDHSYSTEWSSNGTYHWHECLNCSAKTDEATHIPDSAKTTYTQLSSDDVSYNQQHEVNTICKTCGHETTTKSAHIYKDAGSELNGYTGHGDGETHTKKCLKCGYTTTEECSGSQSDPKTCQYCGQSLLTVSQGQIKTPELISIDSGDTSVCKFSLVRDTAVELKFYKITFYVDDVAIGENIGSPHWTYTYDNSTNIFTITITGFSKCNTKYSITAEAADQKGNYDTSERSAVLSFTTGHVGTISTVTYINQGADVGHKEKVRCSNCEEQWVTNVTNHTWGDPTPDATGHTHTRICTASGCAASKTESCQYDVQNDDTCTACGGKKADTHVWEGTPVSNNDHTTHTYYCTVSNCDGSKQENCDFQSTEDTCRLCGQNKNHNQTWDITSTTHRKYCTNCNEDIIPKASHTWHIDNIGHCTTCQYDCPHGVTATGVSWYGDWTYSSATKHSHTCNNCGYIETEDHTWSEWDNGTRKCTKCGVKDAHVSHSYEYIKTALTHTPTCKVCGITQDADEHIWNTANDLEQCTTCGKICEHEYDSGKTAWSDWSGNISLATRICRICGKTEECKHPNLQSEDADEGTVYCSNCKMTFNCNHPGYTYTDISGGQHQKMCTQCGKDWIESHNYNYERSTNNKHIGTCSNCGATTGELSCEDNGSGVCIQCGEGIVKEEIKE